MTFDWSKAPEGATHIVDYVYGLPENMRVANSRNYYRKQVDGTWFGFDGGKWHLIISPEVQSYQKLPESLTDEGLPPVGTVCEHHKLGGVVSDGASWTTVKIVAHIIDDKRISPVAVYMPCAGSPPYVGQGTADAFRPIRTPEQIAAEEREIRISEIRSVLSVVDPCGDPAIALEAAGYRKQVTK